MKQCKHPFVKKMRKAGYSSAESQRIVQKAILTRNKWSGRWYGINLDCWFTWSNSQEGHDYWSNINCITG